ncbi:hypothetical protein ACHAXM_000693 [Skeletonema potamos]
MARIVTSNGLKYIVISNAIPNSNRIDDTEPFLMRTAFFLFNAGMSVENVLRPGVRRTRADMTILLGSTGDEESSSVFCLLLAGSSEVISSSSTATDAVTVSSTYCKCLFHASSSLIIGFPSSPFSSTSSKR